MIRQKSVPVYLWRSPSVHCTSVSTCRHKKNCSPFNFHQSHCFFDVFRAWQYSMRDNEKWVHDNKAAPKKCYRKVEGNFSRWCVVCYKKFDACEPPTPIPLGWNLLVHHSMTLKIQQKRKKHVGNHVICPSSATL